MFEERAGERRVFDDRYVVLPRDLANPFGDQILAFGHHDRRAHVLAIVAQRNREVRRVGDDHIGGRHVRHHPLFGDGALPRPDAGLQLRIALRLLALLLDLLLAHFELLLVLPALIEVVDRCEHQHAHHDTHRHIEEDAANKAERVHDVHARSHHKLGIAVAGGGVRDRPDEADLDNRLGQVDECATGEEPLQTFGRIDAIEIGGHRFGREDGAVGLRNINRDRESHADRQYGTHRLDNNEHGIPRRLHDDNRREVRHRHVIQHGVHVVLDRRSACRAEVAHGEQEAEEDEGGGKVGGARHLAAPAGFTASPGSGGLRSFAHVFGQCASSVAGPLRVVPTWLRPEECVRRCPCRL